MVMMSGAKLCIQTTAEPLTSSHHHHTEDLMVRLMLARWSKEKEIILQNQKYYSSLQ